MKDKWKKTVKIAAAAAACLMACQTLVYFFDYVLNGVLTDWFTANYTFAVALDNGEYAYSIDWSRMRHLFFVMLVLITCLCALSARLYGAWKVRRSISDTGKMIHQYMNSSLGASDIFPQKYAEISARVTEIKAAKQHSEQLLKDEATRKNDLIVYLAHDLKTPLTSVIGYLSLLDDIPEMPLEQRAKYVKITLEKARRLEMLINEFFDITRYNLQRITLEKETVDLHFMLVQTTDEFYPLLNAHGNTAVLHAEEDLTVMADPVKLARVFNNILKNAVAYSYPGTAIDITAQKESGSIRLTFSNHGKTIPEHKLDMIFEKFFRLDDARSANTGGAGLGLAIAKEIVALHGGSISAASENEITTFTVLLPE